MEEEESVEWLSLDHNILCFFNDCLALSRCFGIVDSDSFSHTYQHNWFIIISPIYIHILLLTSTDSFLRTSVVCLHSFGRNRRLEYWHFHLGSIIKQKSLNFIREMSIERTWCVYNLTHMVIRSWTECVEHQRKNE